VRKIEKECPVIADHNIRMAAFNFVVHSFARLIKQIILLPDPLNAIIRKIYTEPVPDINNHPVTVFPLENFRAFAGTVANHLAVIFPFVQVSTVGMVDLFPIDLIVIPQTPHAPRQSHDTGIYNLVGG